MRIALVHDYLNQYGGAERVLEILCELFPAAPLYTLLYDERATHGKFRQRKIVTSFLQKIIGARTHHRWFFPLAPRAVERWNFSKFDLVISQSAAFAKGIIVPPQVRHLCYLLTPTRFLWDEAQLRLSEELSWFLRPAAHFLIRRLRQWDWRAAKRPNRIIPVSHHIRQLSRRIYKRDIDDVIYPPVDVKRLSIPHPRPPEPKPYFLIVSRLIPYKRIDIAIRACEKLLAPLRIIGTGRDRARLAKLTGPNTQLLGELPQDLTDAYFQHAEALLMPQVEDFGIAAVEAMAAGTPVIAYRRGGAVETVVAGQTGLFFDEQTPTSLAGAIHGFAKTQFNPSLLGEHAKQFDASSFREQFINRVKSFIT